MKSGYIKRQVRSRTIRSPLKSSYALGCEIKLWSEKEWIQNIIKVNWGEIILYDVKVKSSYKFPGLHHWNHPNARCFFGRYAVRESFQYCLLQKDYTVCQVTVRISKFVSWKYLKIIKFCSKGSQGLCPCATSLASNKKAKWKCYSSGVKN